MRILAKSRHVAAGLAALAIGLAPPAGAQTYSPTSAWTVTTNAAAVTALTYPPSGATAPFTFSMATPTATNSYPVTVTSSQIGAGNVSSFTYGGPVYQFTGTGTQGSVTEAQQGYIAGPNFNITANAAISNNNTAALPASATSLSGMPSLLAVSSFGANGAPAASEKHPGGGSYNAGAGGSVIITQTGNLTLGVSGFSNPNNVTISAYNPVGSAIIATSKGGVGSDPYDNNLGPGGGGNGGQISITASQGYTTTLQNTTQAGAVNGITALSVGNSGGIDYDSSKNLAAWGSSGGGGPVNVTLQGTLTAGAGNNGNLIGIAAASVGGSPIAPTNDTGYCSCYAGLYPNSGSGGTVTVTMSSGASINLSTGNAIGVLATSAAGSYGLNGSSSGYGGAVTVSNLGTITTGNANASFAGGIIAVSAGSSSLIDPFGTHAVGIGTLGLAGTVNVSNGTSSQTGASISTTGTLSVGMAGLSLGTASVVTGAASSGVSVLGNSSAYGTATSSSSLGATGSVTLSNTGTITTTGASAFGMVAMSVPAGGLLLSNVNSTYSGSTVSGGQYIGNSSSNNAASGGTVTVTNAGSITTGSSAGGGNMAIGILAQSIGGGGGSSGGNGAAAFVGDQGGSGGAGGAITITNSGTITTANDGAIGILTQSVGGGGGNGGNAAGLFVAVGGQGGLGGAGGAITLNLGATSGSVGSITTSGDFAMGVVAHSIGGGGGNGGYAKSVGLGFSNAIGGAGGSGGAGGDITFSNNGQPITTGSTSANTGNGAHGVLLQSIGGGGGTGGGAISHVVGATFGESLAVGGTGGSGGAGGSVTVTNSGAITTYNPDAMGLLVQSIGGGGGNAGGAMAKALTIAADPDFPTLSFSTAVGGTGGSGGAGGTITITNTGSLTTAGSSAFGINAQSIGGGGGNGGDSTAGNTLVAGKSGGLQIGTSLGGSGGTASNGGSVSITNGSSGSTTAGAITTLGNNATAMLAQSIGGGGGTGGGGNAASGAPNLGGAGVSPGFVLGITTALGGKAGGGGSGGEVSVTNYGPVSTIGSGGQGILAQSIGGGGGSAGGGSAAGGGSPVNINTSVGGSGGSGGAGGSVSVTNSAKIITGQTSGSLPTGGDAVGIMAQSIGGGGGTGGSSDPVASISTLTMLQNVLAESTPLAYAANLNIGGSGGSGGAGGAVTVSNSGSIYTLGLRAHGILAQSIGGGGGWGGAVVTQPGTVVNNFNAAVSQWVAPTISSNIGLGGSGGSGGAGGAVSIANSGTVLTTGYGALGMLAQSIGGGGGVGADGSTGMGISIMLGGSGGDGGTGGTVSLGTSSTPATGTLTTLGDDAHGILAQSIGGGGGIAAGWHYDPSAQVVMGNAAQLNNVTTTAVYSGQSSPITINQTGGTITTSGAGSIGILAQGSGMVAGTMYPINISIGGTVSGGTGSGVGILVSGGSTSAINGTPNTITVNSGGAVTSAGGASGTAILANSGYTNVTVNSGGTVTGSVNLGSTPGDMTVNSGGTFNAGPTVVVAQSTLTNAGNLFIAGQGAIGTTTVSGGFKQTATGILGIDVNALAPQRSDQLNILGKAQIGGTIVPTATTLLPGSLPIVTATTLSSTATVQQSIAFGWNAAVNGNTLAVTPVATFRPAGLSLSRSQGGVADYLTRGWNNNDQRFAGTFGYLSQIQGGQQYVSTLATVAGQAHTAQPQAMLNNAPMILGSAMGCPAFASAGTVLLESGCLWARLTGGWGRQSTDGGDAGYNLSSVFYRLGGQYEVAPGWFLGAGFGFGQNWTQATGFSSTGTLYDGSVTLQRSLGRWSFTGALAVGSGEFRNSRSFVLPSVGTLPGTSAAFQSNSNLLLFGGRARAAYEVPFSSSYVKPYADLDLVYTQMPGFQESGAAGLPLSFNGSSKTNVFFSPMVEFGARQNLGGDVVMRPYLDLGMTFRPDISRSLQAQVIGASGADGTFNVYGNAPTVVGRMNLGMQLYHSRGIDLRLEYGLMLGGTYTGQTASARFGYQF